MPSSPLHIYIYFERTYLCIYIASLSPIKCYSLALFIYSTETLSLLLLLAIFFVLLPSPCGYICTVLHREYLTNIRICNNHTPTDREMENTTGKVITCKGKS